MGSSQGDRIIALYGNIMTVNNNFSELAHSIVNLNRSIARNLTFLSKQQNKPRKPRRQFAESRRKAFYNSERQPRPTQTIRQITLNTPNNNNEQEQNSN